MNEQLVSLKKPNSKKGLWILAAIIAVVALPEIVAVTLHVIEWRPKSTTNQGQLITPARPIQNLPLITIDGNAIKFDQLHGKWSMVTFGDSTCSELCKKNIYTMRQLHVGQGKEQGRIQRILILADNKATNSLKKELNGSLDMTIIVGPTESITMLTKQFTLPGATSVALGAIYLVDPKGNLFMSYEASQDPKGIHKDLIQLLKNSWVG